MSKDVNESHLIKLVQNGDDAAYDILLSNYKNLLYNLVNRFTYYFDKEELFQVASIAFYKAIIKFELDYNNKLSTYAFTVILGDLKRFVRDNNTLKVSREIITIKTKVDHFIARYLDEHDIRPPINVIVTELGYSKERVLEALNYQSKPISLDKPIEHQENSLSLHDVIGDYTNKNWFEKVLIKTEVEKLSDFDRVVVHLRYTLDLTQSDVAKRLKISQVQVSRIENKILNNLKKKLVNI